MADDDWESRDFDEVEVPKPVVRAAGDKWEGEDEEEPAKDNFDDDESKPAVTRTDPPKKKKGTRLAEAIAEKERKAADKLRANMTPEELAAEKLRQLKMQEEMEIQMVKSTFGSVDEIDIADPMTKDDFDALRKKIVLDLRRFEKRAPFEDFLEDCIQDLCLSLPSKRLKQVKTKIEALYFEKNKAEKAATTTTKAKAKSAGKAKLTVEKSDLTNVEVGYEHDDYDDFM